MGLYRKSHEIFKNAFRFFDSYFLKTNFFP